MSAGLTSAPALAAALCCAANCWRSDSAPCMAAMLGPRPEAVAANWLASPACCWRNWSWADWSIDAACACAAAAVGAVWRAFAMADCSICRLAAASGSWKGCDPGLERWPGIRFAHRRCREKTADAAAHVSYPWSWLAARASTLAQAAPGRSKRRGEAVPIHIRARPSLKINDMALAWPALTGVTARKSYASSAQPSRRRPPTSRRHTPPNTVACRIERHRRRRQAIVERHADLQAVVPHAAPHDGHISEKAVAVAPGAPARSHAVRMRAWYGRPLSAYAPGFHVDGPIGARPS